MAGRPAVGARHEIELRVAPPEVGRGELAQVRRREAQRAAGPEHAPELGQDARDSLRREVLRDVLGEYRRQARVGDHRQARRDVVAQRARRYCRTVRAFALPRDIFPVGVRQGARVSIQVDPLARVPHSPAALLLHLEERAAAHVEARRASVPEVHRSHVARPRREPRIGKGGAPPRCRLAVIASSASAGGAERGRDARRVDVRAPREPRRQLRLEAAALVHEDRVAPARPRQLGDDRGRRPGAVPVQRGAATEVARARAGDIRAGMRQRFIRIRAARDKQD